MASRAASYNMLIHTPPVLGHCHQLSWPRLEISKCRCGGHGSHALNRPAHATCRNRAQGYPGSRATGSRRSLVFGLGGGGTPVEGGAALAAVSGPRWGGLDRLERNIGHGNANDRARNPLRAIDTLQFRLLVGWGAWRRLRTWALARLLSSCTSPARGDHDKGGR